MVKKLVVKLRSAPAPADDAQRRAERHASQAETLREAVHAIHASRNSAPLEELFSAVEGEVQDNEGSALHALLGDECQRKAAAEVAALAEGVALDSSTFLQHVVRLWETYSSQLSLIRQVFLYLDRAYVVANPGTLSVFQLGLRQLRAQLEALPHVHHRIVEALLQLVEAERGGEAVNRHLLKHAVDMLSNLRLYEDGVQDTLLSSASQYYTRESAQLINELELAAYLLHCERRLAEEYDRCEAYLGLHMRRPLKEIIDTCLLEAHLTAILEASRGLLAACAEPDLARLHTMCVRIGALPGLRSVFRDYIRATGSAVVLDEVKEAELVPRMLQFRRDMQSVLHNSFAGHTDFAQALKEGFEACLNSRVDKPAELIARYLDSILRRGSKAGAQDGSLEEVLDAALALFRYVQGKDVFEAFYKRILSRRLLMGRSASMDAEKMCISKIKAECGAQFTNQLEGMLKDIELSADIQAGYKQFVAARPGGGGLDTNVLVLTSGFWPTYRSFDCLLPAELATAQQEFAEFYLSKHGGRKLAWQSAPSSCVVRAHFTPGVKELQASLHQACILLLFNESAELSFADIQAALKLEESELRRTLASLSLAKDKVLLKEPAASEITPSDVFRFNAAFASRLYRVKINNLQMHDTDEDSKKTNEQVLQDRFHQIDAAIVRIMKMRKALSHNLLLGELASQLRFPVGQSDVKKRIESLIDREYLQRVDTGYEYLA
ncbi:cullin 4 [Micractinium conductrix]|uniref:Cullin 4 n=1 Tax=Micractinium conductrix TaxID=554055 RepID=A0A2P6VKY1_9CHLO|nr:cullin 4 [Micractinium conductrix]|eukprot:PSC74717.1 cullin 4 [Micractinium conductrix]